MKKLNIFLSLALLSVSGLQAEQKSNDLWASILAVLHLNQVSAVEESMKIKIIDAINSGDLEFIKENVNANNVSTPLDENGWTAFIYAAADSQIPIMDYLYENYYQCINDTTSGGGTAFMEAARNNQVKTLKWFDVNGLIHDFINKADTAFGNTALMEVAFAGPQIQKAKVLLFEYGANVTLTNKAGLTAEQIALQHGWKQRAWDKGLKAFAQKMNRIDKKRDS